jgi:MSHA biogenesis protein MshK
MMRYDLLSAMLAVLIGTGTAYAQVSDPTRPAGGPVATEAGSGAVAAPEESGVQTVIVRPGGKSAAVINGQYVVVGGKFGDKRVLRITESEIVLKGENGREVIKVTPSVEKTPARKTAAKTQRTTGTAQQ